ncbi:MAG: alpha/beta fold hydrolase [Actinomycetota bacterium]
MTAYDTARPWQDLGDHRSLLGHRVFTVVAPPLGPETAEPLLVLHGYPTSSLDYRVVLDGLRRSRRVLLFDMLGYGFSAKPDRGYTMALQADLAQAFVADVGVERLALLTHDMGNTVGGELLARHAEGTWGVEVTRRVVTNGSIYIEMAQLTAGQQLLLSLPDARLDPALAPDVDALTAALVATFSSHAAVAPDEVRAQAEAILHDEGNLVLARTIRYIEERRRAQGRFTGAIETHPSPVGIVWGLDDPIAVPAMADRLQAARPEAPLVRLDRVGHYPMVESPERFLTAVTPMLDGVV